MLRFFFFLSILSYNAYSQSPTSSPTTAYWTPLNDTFTVVVAVVFSLFLMAFLVSWIALFKFRKGYHLEGRMPIMMWGVQVGLIVWVIYYLVALIHEPSCYMSRFSGFYLYPIFAFYWVRAFKLIFQWEIALKLNEFHSLPRSEKTSRELYGGKGGFFVRHRKWITPKYLYSIVAVYIAIHLFLAIVSCLTLCPMTVARNQCGLECAVSGSRLIILFVVEVVLLVLFFICNMRKGQDALKVKVELTVGSVFVIIASSVATVLFLKTTTTIAIIFVCFSFTAAGCCTIWFPIVLDMRMRRRHEARPPKFTLATILEHPAGFQSVAAFLKLEFSAENAYFYQRVEEYRDPANRGEGAAEYLYDTFIAADSPYQVNLSAAVANNIAERLGRSLSRETPSISMFAKYSHRRNDRALSTTTAADMKAHGRTHSSLDMSPEDSISLFDEAQAEVLRLMIRDSWMRYLQSPQFAEYARDHMKNAALFVDNVEEKMRATTQERPSFAFGDTINSEHTTGYVNMDAS